MLEFEKKVIGCAINNPDEIPTMMATGLTSKMFTSEDCQKLWLYLVEFKGIRETPPIPAPPSFYAECADAALTLNCKVMAGAQVADHRRRQLAGKMSSLAVEIASLQPFERTDYKKDALALLIEATTGDGGFLTPGYDVVVDKMTDRLEERIHDFRAGRKNIVSTGFRVLDKATGGFVPRRLYVIAARTGCGKTTLAINMADCACEAGASVGFFTVEMEDIEILEKIVSRRTGIDSRAIDIGAINQEQSIKISDALGRIERKLFINHRFRAEYEKLEVEIRRLKASEGLNVVFVDYIQQLRITDTNHRMRHLELSEITSRLKALAMELEIAVVILAQLNRAAVVEEDIPRLHHLKDSGSIEQDADVVLFIHTLKDDLALTETWLHIEKNRRGPRGRFRVTMELPVNFFGNSNQDTFMEPL